MEERRSLKTKDAVIMYLVATLFSVFLSIPLVFAKEGYVKIVVSYLIPQVAYAICVFGYLYAGKFKLVDVIPIKKKTSPILLFVSAVIAVALIAQDHILMVAFSLLMEKMGLSLFVEIPSMSNWYMVIITVIVIGILPPIFEEIMFRGVFLSAVRPKGMKYSIIITALIFALSHLNFAQLVHQFIVGLVLGYMAYKSKNIIYPIVVHMTNNMLALGLSNWDFYNSLITFSPKNTLIMVAFCLGGASLLFFCIKIFNKESHSLERTEAFEKKDYKNKEMWYNTTTANGSMEGAFNNNFPAVENEEQNHALTEEEIIDKALKSLKENPPKMLDLWIFGLCSFLVLMLVFTTIATRYL